jgi:hypothetical protein
MAFRDDKAKVVNGILLKPTLLRLEEEFPLPQGGQYLSHGLLMLFEGGGED